MSNWNGKTLGKVKIGELIARGGMAEVYLGEHTTLNRKVAVKIMRDHVNSDRKTISALNVKHGLLRGFVTQISSRYSIMNWWTGSPV